MFELIQAWNWRERQGLFENSEALRVFHGPGEGSHSLRSYAVDRFGDYYWITEWEGLPIRGTVSSIYNQFIEFYASKGALSIVILSRPEGGKLPDEPRLLFGTPPQGRIEVRELNNRFKVQFVKTMHPGLFLDHQPLRLWLEKASRGLSVLNTFAYTGSLSVAARRGGALRKVTTLDLSKASMEWARENMALNGFEDNANQWIAGDVFEWLPRLKRAGEKYDLIILDPPSFSRMKKTKFSTQKDLTHLHSLALELLADKGYLITSINSANISWKKFEADFLAASVPRKIQFTIHTQIDLPESFPTLLGDSSSRYLKGWVLRRI